MADIGQGDDRLDPLVTKALLQFQKGKSPAKVSSPGSVGQTGDAR
jgi:hypothetical protein